MSQGNRLCARSIASTTSPPSRVTSGRHSVHPVATSTIVSVWMNEPATRRAAVRHHVDLAEAGRRIVPVVERADRHLAPDRRVEADATALPPAAAILVSTSSRSIVAALTPAPARDRPCRASAGLPLQRRQQRRDHHLEPLAADPIGRLPQRHQRILDRRAVGRLAAGAASSGPAAGSARPTPVPRACDANPSPRTVRRGSAPSPPAPPTR